MLNFKKPVVLFLVFLVVDTKSLPAQNAGNYKQQIEAWHRQRIAALLAPDGWINLEGLFWLKPGKNSFGSDTSNDISYRNNLFPASAGFFDWQNGKVSWTSSPSIKVSVHDSAVTNILLYEAGSKPLQLALGSFRWSLIKRDEKIGVRFRNLSAKALTSFKGVERFPVDAHWKIQAHLTQKARLGIAITNVLGQTNTQPSPGVLEFSINGKQYHLDALEEGNELFIIFGDATSGKESYPTGRFLYAALPDTEGNTWLDFNKAINPPCAFTIYATCPLPPPQNILPIAITAGEKGYHLKK